jgi:Protein of unknown function (DUF2911)
MKTKALSLMLVIMITSIVAWAQEKKASPAATATGKIGDATITINYSSPSVKGRKIFGGLEPYGKAWRAGANEATTFETDKDILVEGKPLPKGKYSFFVTPGEKEWTIIFNSKMPPWGIKRSGEANFDPADNVLTVNVTPKKIPLQEKLVYEVKANSVSLKWEYSDASFSVK